MMDWLKNAAQNLRGMWQKWSLVQRLILVGIVVAALVAIAALLSVSATPGMVPVIDSPIRDEDKRDAIVTRINQEGIKTQVDAAGVVSVPTEEDARKMRNLLIREDLIPQGTDPWAIFDRERWTITDFERNVNLQRAITQMVTEHIKALDDVDDANVVLVVPDHTLFAADQNPTTASVIITPKPGSDIAEDTAASRKKIQGIQKLLKFAVAGLTDENITITDQSGNVLNDFAGMAESDRLSLIAKQQKLIRDEETQLRAKILAQLQQTFTKDRAREANVKIEMDMSKKSVTSTVINPIVLKPRTPGLPYDDSQMVPSVTVSEETSSTSWEGTGFNPEGPAGVEGQTPPAYKDMSNLYGKVTQNTKTHNEELNKSVIAEEQSPQMGKRTVSVNIDGTWARKYDEKGKLLVKPSGEIEREYTPVEADALANAQRIIEGAIGYSAAREDSVIVTNIPYDRTAQFADEDAAYAKAEQMKWTVVFALAAVVLLVIGFILFQMLNRAREAARRRKEEQLAREHQLMRDSALLEAEKEGETPTMSPEDQARAELQERVATLAREHPEEAGQLIRTWLMEE